MALAEGGFKLKRVTRFGSICSQALLWLLLAVFGQLAHGGEDTKEIPVAMHHLGETGLQRLIGTYRHL